jgi:endonuclease/exonuclease/phosphatase family metal-dependent hydrolase
MRSVLAACTAAAMVGSPAIAADSFPPPPAPGVFRVATFNASLNRDRQDALRRELATSDSAQARAVAEIIQRIRPDILLLQEFDHDPGGEALAGFRSNYLGRSQRGAEPIHYRHSFFGESNTGQPSGFDLDNDGMVGGGQDALGFGEFPGQYAMVLLSRFPIDARNVRTFRKFPWRELPGARLPDDPRTAPSGDWYSSAELAVLPLSSKSHWDVPVRIGRRTLHVLASHPTPPAFDGAEDRNGLRNHDELRFWSHYLDRRAGFPRDDAGRRGGLRGRHFVLLGDLNSDPVDGASRHDAVLGLLAHRHINATVTPMSAGAAEAADVQGGLNASHRGDPRADTADFNDRAVGNLRVDYVLPSRTFAICDSGVFWPRREQPGAELVWGDRPPSSDHRLVWLDLTADAGRCPPGSDPKAIVRSHPRR